MLKNITLIFVVLLYGGCTKKLEHIPSKPVPQNDTYVGLIDDNFVDKLSNHTLAGETVILTSLGGSHDASIRASKIIIEKKLNITIKDFCISACAEIILPSASSVKFLDKPIVGFHWGPQLISDIIREETGSDAGYCDFNQEKDIQDLYKKTGHNLKFWQEIEARIEVKKTSIYLGIKTCPTIKFVSLKNDLWLPSSQQLKNQLNLNFTGSVCADYFDICKNKITTFWNKEARYLISNKVFAVKQQQPISIK